MRRFEGRVAVVSGAAQGMGKAVALRLGEEGATVVAVDINEAGVAATAQGIGGGSIGVGCDIGDEGAVARLFETVAGKFGKLDVLVNAAAIVPFVKWDALTFTEWRRVLRVNLDGLYLMCRAGSELMRKNEYGRIVNFSSNSIFAGTPNMAHYVASKGGVLTFTRALATELGPFKITANSICPGLIDTEGVQSRAGGCRRTWCRPSRSSPPTRRTGSRDRRSTSMPAWCAGRLTPQLLFRGAARERDAPHREASQREPGAHVPRRGEPEACCDRHAAKPRPDGVRDVERGMIERRRERLRIARDVHQARLQDRGERSAHANGEHVQGHRNVVAGCNRIEREDRRRP